MKLFVDDIRNPPDKTWTVARTYEEAMRRLATGKVTEISLDHDLGEEKSGHDIIAFLEEAAAQRHPGVPRTIHIHTANPVGRTRMEAARKNIERELRTCDSCARFQTEGLLCWGKAKVEDPAHPPCRGKAWKEAT